MALTKKAAPSNSDEWVGFFVAVVKRMIDTGEIKPHSKILTRIAEAIFASGDTSYVLRELLEKIEEYQQ